MNETCTNLGQTIPGLVTPCFANGRSWRRSRLLLAENHFCVVMTGEDCYPKTFELLRLVRLYSTRDMAWRGVGLGWVGVVCV